MFYWICSFDFTILHCVECSFPSFRIRKSFLWQQLKEWSGTRKKLTILLNPNKAQSDQFSSPEIPIRENRRLCSSLLVHVWIDTSWLKLNYLFIAQWQYWCWTELYKLKSTWLFVKFSPSRHIRNYLFLYNAVDVRIKIKWNSTNMILLPLRISYPCTTLGVKRVLLPSIKIYWNCIFWWRNRCPALGSEIITLQVRIICYVLSEFPYMKLI